VLIIKWIKIFGSHKRMYVYIYLSQKMLSVPYEIYMCTFAATHLPTHSVRLPFLTKS